MKKTFTIIMIGMLLFVSCTLLKPKPQGFTYTFDNRYTGLDTLVDINGYYISKSRYNMSTIYMFYSNGIIVRSNVSEVTPEVIESFTNNSIDQKLINWGTYVINKDTIHAELIYTNGWTLPSVALMSNFVIISNSERYGEFRKIAFVVKDENSEHLSIGQFYPLESKRDYHDCPWLKKKWFNTKE